MMRGVPVALGVALPLGAALVAVAPALGVAAHLVLLGVVLASLGTGRLLCRALGIADDPFLALVAGHAVVAHALVLGDLAVPGAHPAIALGFLLLAVPGLRGPAPRHAAALAVLAGLFVAAWCWDIAPRMSRFEATGRLDFWVDLIVHATNLLQFTGPEAIGRGLILMADTPRMLYHTATLMPVALLPPLAGTTALDAVALAWIPLGMVVMAAGVVSLGLALGGPGLAAAGLLALALVPDPEQWTLANGFLGFAWLLETSPGTAYSVGVGCAALAALVRAARTGRYATLLLAALLTAGCILVRANTFVWLAPTMVLGTIAAWHWPGPRLRLGLVLLGLAGMAGALALLSWQPLLEDPRRFLFGYVNWAFSFNPPTRVDGLLPALEPAIGRIGAGAVALLLVLLGTLGPWLPGGLLLGALAWRRGMLARVDALPFILLLATAVLMLLAPMSRNGDISEFRHRAGPFLVAAWAVWTLRFGALLLATRLEAVPAGRRAGLAAAAAAIALPVLALCIGAAKRPAMGWGGTMHGTHVPPDLVRLAGALRREGEEPPRFAVANQPADARNIDDASRLVAFSGMPAFIACPHFMFSSGGIHAREAARRMEVIRGLAAAPDLPALRAIMREERITHYVVIGPAGAPFDPGRSAAAARFGDHAVYLDR